MAAAKTKAPAITLAALQGAEKIAGVKYTAAERRQMLGNIGAQIEQAQRRRRTLLPATLAPATRFDPRLPGWQPSRAGGFKPAAAPAMPPPENDDDIACAPVAWQSAWIRAEALTSERLTEIYLGRIARYGRALECFAEVTADLARAQARAADKLLQDGTWRGPLHGIPWGCKDILDTAGIGTRYGAEPYKTRVPGADATVVTRLRDAGAVLLGKTTVGALAYGDIWYGGVTRNPWNRQEGSSGSSAGSASATAAGLVGFGLGTETLGSLVAPSERCGTTALRPTFGRVPRTGAMPLCWTLDKIGPICRSVEDTALVLSALLGPDPADPCQIDLPFSYNATASLRGLRVGYFPADVEGADPLDKAAIDKAGELGLAIVPLELPPLPYDTLMSLLFAEAAASFEQLTLSNADDTLTWQEDGAWPNTFRKSRFLSAVDHVQLDRLRRQAMEVMDGIMGEVDAIIGPPLAGPMLIISNFTGHPCLILRAGFIQSPTRSQASLSRGRIDQGKAKGTRRYTVPHGLCVYGRLYDEGTILRIGTALEAAFGVWDKRPELGRGRKAR
jgi:Asp-tRNA(Asn)/Glu-tRNA(Gln) amidotransferase A subunit family amidase